MFSIFKKGKRLFTEEELIFLTGTAIQRHEEKKEIEEQKKANSREFPAERTFTKSELDSVVEREIQKYKDEQKSKQREEIRLEAISKQLSYDIDSPFTVRYKNNDIHVFVYGELYKIFSSELTLLEHFYGNKTEDQLINFRQNITELRRIKEKKESIDARVKDITEGMGLDDD